LFSSHQNGYFGNGQRYIDTQGVKVKGTSSDSDWKVGRCRVRIVSALFAWLILIIALSAGAYLWFQRVAVLQDAATLWIISDPVIKADAAVVLGGGSPEVRPFLAAQFYREGFTSKILLSRVPDGHAATVSGLPRDTEFNRDILLKLGVPPAAIEIFGTGNASTAEEALALRQWAKRTGPSVLLVPIEIFSARRVQWIFRHEFVGMGVQIETPSFEPKDYTRTAWWTTTQGRRAFGSEVVKYAYYRLRY
jgi:uncharacterized SAM-binding protein YcdF (DUF218 family)